MWQAWVNGVIGLWLIVAAFVIAGSKTGNLINCLIAGIVMLVLGLWAGVSHKSWRNCIVAVVGAWMIVAGFWFPSIYEGNVANNIAAGVVVAIASFWPGFSYALRAKQE